MTSPRKLPFRIGCPLALLLTAIVIIAVEIVHPRPWRPGFDHLSTAAIVGAPFALLALARTRDWAAWLVAIALTAGLWAWFLYDLAQNRGVNIGLGFLQLVVAPFFISALALVTAGVRGRIPGVRPDGA
ncbi:MAG TPA: hypothetical protein VEZ20_02790 [Allosphingosinicella sp.]|jgi:hypothetical protein|nr:hypothetical protein [Allosphingosinicella sp.]